MIRGGLRVLRTALPVAAVVVATAVVLRAQGQEDQGGKKIDVCRHRDLDGRGAARVDLATVERRHRSAAAAVAKSFRTFDTEAEESLPKMKSRAHRSGIPAARSEDERRVKLVKAVPPEIRKLTLYFVTALPEGRRPSCLPAELPACEVFVLDADRLEDVSALSRTLKRRVSLASGEFARALGVTARDAVVRFSDDGKTALVREEGP